MRLSIRNEFVKSFKQIKTSNDPNLQNPKKHHQTIHHEASANFSYAYKHKTQLIDNQHCRFLLFSMFLCFAEVSSWKCNLSHARKINNQKP